MREAKHVQLDGREIDTSSQEWQLICLARHICRMPTKEHRHAFIARLKWTAEATEQLKDLIRIEWQRMYPNTNKKVEAAAHDND